MNQRKFLLFAALLLFVVFHNTASCSRKGHSSRSRSSSHRSSSHSSGSHSSKNSHHSPSSSHSHHKPSSSNNHHDSSSSNDHHNPTSSITPYNPIPTSSHPSYGWNSNLNNQNNVQQPPTVTKNTYVPIFISHHHSSNNYNRHNSHPKTSHNATKTAHNETTQVDLAQPHNSTQYPATQYNATQYPAVNNTDHNDSILVNYLESQYGLDSLKNLRKRNVNTFHASRRTSCGFGLCNFSPNYPYQQINDAINLVRGILTSRNEFLHKQGNRIDKAVLQYQPKQFNELRTNYKDYSEDGCTVHANVTRPLEGVSVDKKTYYIVNIPSFQQRVQFLKCNSGKECNHDGETAAMCKQTYRKEELLVLPINKIWYDIGDFKVKTFRVPTGCQCKAYPYNTRSFEVQRA